MTPTTKHPLQRGTPVTITCGKEPQEGYYRKPHGNKHQVFDGRFSLILKTSDFVIDENRPIEPEK